MTEKVLGYILITFGIITIIYSGFSVYQVFTKQAQPVALFAFPGLSLDPAMLMSAAQPGVKLPSTGQKMEIVPAQIVNSTSNLLAHLLLMGFMAGIGVKIAGIGVNLVRPIKVNLNQEK
jgi:hypothetical protein